MSRILLKTKTEEAPSDLAIIGRYLLTLKFLMYLKIKTRRW